VRSLKSVKSRVRGTLLLNQDMMHPQILHKISLSSTNIGFQTYLSFVIKQ